jgi:hypothetical protein
MIRSLLLRLAACLLLAGFLAPLAAASPGYTVAPAPDWVQERPLPPLPGEQAEGAALEGLLHDRQVRLGANPVTYVRNVRRALEPAGVGQVSEIAIHFNPAYQSLQLHGVAVTRAGVRRELTATVPVRLVQREEELEQGIQDGLVTALISPDDVTVGDLVDVSYSVAGANPIFGGRSFGFLGVDSAFPVEALELRLVEAPGRPLQVRAHADPLPLKRRTVAGRTEYHLRLRKLKAVQAEAEAPAWRNGVNWLEYSEFGSWKDVVDWGMALYDIPDATGPGFEAVYASLAAGATSQADFAARALRYTQETIRYLGLEFGEGSHRPNAPELVIARKFGDCKDKSLLLTRLLRRHGIDAAPALVGTGYREGIASALPGPGVFDHVITRVVLDGRRYWLDGTRLYQGGRLDRIGVIDYGQALVLEPGQAAPAPMFPEFPLELSSSVEEHYYATDFSGPVRFVVTSRYLGNAAESQRYQLRSTSRAALQDKLLDYYSQFHDGIAVAAPLEVRDDVDGNVVTVTETYRVPDFWRREGKMLSHRMLVLAFHGLLDTPREVNRRSPLLLSQPRYVSSRSYVHYPTDVKMKLDAAPVRMEGPGFSYVFKDRYADNTYYHQAEFTILRPWIEAAEAPVMLTALRKARREMDFSMSFQDPASTGLPDIERLREAYAEKGKRK